MYLLIGLLLFQSMLCVHVWRNIKLKQFKIELILHGQLSIIFEGMKPSLTKLALV